MKTNKRQPNPLYYQQCTLILNEQIHRIVELASSKGVGKKNQSSKVKVHERTKS